MSNIMTGRWVSNAMATGFVLASSTVAMAQALQVQTLTFAGITVSITHVVSFIKNGEMRELTWKNQESEGTIKSKVVPDLIVTLGGLSVPLKDIESLKKLEKPDKKWELKWKNQESTGKITNDDEPTYSSSIPPTSTGSPPLQKGVLTYEQEHFIRRELEAMVAHGTDESASSLRERVRDKAEGMAEEFLKIGKNELYQDSSLLTRLQNLVDSAMALHRPRTVPYSAGYETRPPRTVREPSDDESRSRCECVYCHPLHQAGTCSLPYAPMTVPMLPGAASYAPAIYYAYPYGQKHRHLHGVFCTCSWCRRW
jgi:hypothetical protein